MNDQPNSQANPHTHRSGNEAWEWCKCSECGGVEVCTPARDFYTREGRADSLLVCDTCINGPMKRVEDINANPPNGAN